MGRLAWVVILVATAALSVGAAGCGGAGEELTTEEYGAELNAICEAFNTKMKRSVDDFRDDLDRVEQAELGAYDDLIAEVEVLEPPDELANTADELIATRKEQRELVVQTIDQGAQGDEAGLNAPAEQSEAL